MRALALPLLVLVALGCAKGPANRGGGSTKGKPPAQTQEDPIVRDAKSADLVGAYTGTLLNKQPEEDTALPPSIALVVGDSSLTLDDGGRFTMTHLGINFGGTYTVEDGRLTLLVDEVEGLTNDQIVATDLKANKAAGKEPASEEMLALYRLIMNLTDWRFEVRKGRLTQVKGDAGQPQYEFKPKSD